MYAFLGNKDNLGIHYSHHAHAFTDEDWTAMMDFMDWRLRGMKSDKTFNTFLTMDERMAAEAAAAANAPRRPAAAPAGDPGPPQ